VVVPGAHREHVRVRLDDLVEDPLRDRTEGAGGEQVLVQVDPDLALGVALDRTPVAVTVLTRAVCNERHLPRVDAAIGELARTAVTALRMHVA
jgi:hypothetical protein